MKPLLLILLLAASASAQDWKEIKEMSGEIPNHPGLSVEFYAAEIARGDQKVKLMVKAEFPNGAPVDVFRGTVPFGFDISSVNKLVFKVEFNCDTLVMKTIKNSGELYQFNGTKHKTKEPPFGVNEGHVFVSYFCERGKKPTSAPTLKSNP